MRMVRALRAELGSEQETVQRVARQLGYGVESVRMWVRQADIDEGLAAGVSTAESARVKELEQRTENSASQTAHHRLPVFTAGDRRASGGNRHACPAVAGGDRAD